MGRVSETVEGQSTAAARRSRMRLIAAASLTVVLAVGVSACASESNPGAAPQTDASTTTARPTGNAAPAAEAPAAVTSIPGKELVGTVHALGTVFTPCPRKPEFAAPKVLDFDTGEFVTPPAPTEVPAGAELTAALCTLTGTPDDLKVVYVWRYKTPAAGLTPETWTTMAAVTGIGATAPVQPVDVTAQIPYLGDGAALLPTTGGAILAAGYGCRQCTFALDPNAPRVMWAVDAKFESHDDSSVGFDVDESVVIREVGSGAETRIDGTRFAGKHGGNYSLDSGYLLVEQGGLGDWTFGYYSTVAKRRFEAVFVGDTPGVVITNGRALLQQDDQLKLFDIATGETIFALGPEEMDTLDSFEFEQFGEYLYVRNRNDSPVLDMATRDRVSSGWKVRPAQWINPSWLLVDERNTGVGTCYQSFGQYNCTGIGGMSAEFTLRKIAGGDYPGPFF